MEPQLSMTDINGAQFARSQQLVTWNIESNPPNLDGAYKAEKHRWHRGIISKIIFIMCLRCRCRHRHRRRRRRRRRRHHQSVVDFRYIFNNENNEDDDDDDDDDDDVGI
uniref:Uncharacterized protein n=1 Tax=Glossina pallidipes TaxID=7398 RepID=A0A1B0ACP8_GLOPL